MFDKFCDYMYYLLTSPFKKVMKTLNQWYILFKVLGRRFDDAMDGLYHAGEQTMVTTCSSEMLQVHAEEKNIARYPGEEEENFRTRIANYPEILRLGGSDKGVLVAIKSLGYTDPQIIPANKMIQYFHNEDLKNRWAEFYVIVRMNAGESHPVSLEVLKNEVRKAKYVSAKDNYYFEYCSTVRHLHDINLRTRVRLRLSYWECILLDGSVKLDGRTKLNSRRRADRIKVVHRFRVQHEQNIKVKIGGIEK